MQDQERIYSFLYNENGDRRSHITQVIIDLLTGDGLTVYTRMTKQKSTLHELVQ